jgi:hypothetical protein
MTLQERAQHIADMYHPPATGRPSAIGNPDRVGEFLEAVAAGNYLDTAAHLAGLHKDTVYTWLKRAEQDEEPFKTFADALKKAEASAEADAVRHVRQAGKLPQFWAAEMTFLERRHPERWGRRTDVDLGPKVIVQVGIKDSDVSISVLPPARSLPEGRPPSGDER